MDTNYTKKEYNAREYQSSQQQQKSRHNSREHNKKKLLADSSNRLVKGKQQTNKQENKDRETSSFESSSDKTQQQEESRLLQKRDHHYQQAPYNNNNNMHHHQRYHSRQMVSNNGQNHGHQAMLSHRQATAAMQSAHLHSSLLGGASSQKPNAILNSDNMTSSSSSDHTIDDLHQLARGSNGVGNYNSRSNNSSSTSSSHQAQSARNHQSNLELCPSRSVVVSSSSSSSSSMTSSSGSRFLLGILYTVTELLLFLMLFLWIYWANTHDSGFGWQNDRKQQFNTHGALMLIGFIFFNCQAMLIYRSFQCCSKIYTKILHTILLVLATSAISLGLMLGYTAQENIGPGSKPIMHFYSLHAWIGLTTIVLFALQFSFGFISFLILLCCDSATYSFRSALLPIHRTFGLIIFSLAVSTCLTGLLQTARSRLSSKLNKADYHELTEPGLVINALGSCLICLAIIVPFIIRNLDIQKRPLCKESLNRRLKLSKLDMRI